jgi:drug/metabolite transporter (DMT)-like permease
VATVLGWLVLDERIGPNLLVGLALILGGVMAVNGNVRTTFDRLRARSPARVRA